VIRAHAAAVKTLLSGDATLPNYDGEVPTDAPGQYVVFYLSTPAGVGRRLSADAPKARFLLSTMAVGTSPNECRIIAEKVRARLTRQRLTVTGRICDPFLPPESPAPVRRDPDVNPPAWVATDVWPFTSSLIDT
jgi:hypothetical protein